PPYSSSHTFYCSCVTPFLRTFVLISESASQAGLQKAASSLSGLQGCPILLLSPARHLWRKKRKKEFFGAPTHCPPDSVPRTPVGTLRSLHPRFLERLTEKFGMTHAEWVSRRRK